MRTLFAALFISAAMAAPAPAQTDFTTMRTTALKLENGGFIRTFAGRAAPPSAMTDPRTGLEVRIHGYFPNWNDPIAIDASRELGDGGYRLRTIDRGMAGVIPSTDAAPWALNMIPFGVALDGSIIDPSGPWHDGGPADPKNPFDRKCTGWEYEVLHPDVRHLVGVPDVIPGHVQPGGLFHYHGYPDLLIASLRAQKRAAPDASGAVAAGYSADGYPIVDYVVGGPEPGEGPALFLFSGYALREGARAALDRTNPAYVPSGNYDGLYVQDYEFDPGRKTAQIEKALAEQGEYHGLKADDIRAGRASYALLDARNGYVLRGARQTLTGYPAAHYAYVFTPDWPQAPRLFAFEPDDSFKRIIPFQFQPGAFRRFLMWLGAPGPKGRKLLYDNCPAQQRSVHVWERRSPY